ncbi:glycosyltransferase family 2 protein [Lysobacter sp. H21R4]|uniref:glycosyltransferase n=1 Tax=Lysobacter sp. H21R4 TaxID=2781021 RepID=UPI00188780AC|nr:glycosyltransferase family 2 protein [Lysobacter sp. H21R4]QOY62625.1 glycosyltransferase family 2 protein [Lysobacter sp. H21R4]
MARAPWFAAGPGAWWAMLGHLRPPDPTVPTPAEDWRHAVVDVVIPVCRHHDTVVHCLASLLGQTRLPRRVLLVDDGGIDRDHSLQLAREFARANGIRLETIARGWSIGRVVTLKRQSREFEGDVLLVLDADAVLESPDYIERCICELYQGVGIASASGRMLPLQESACERLETSAPFRNWLGDDDYAHRQRPHNRWQTALQRMSQGYHAHMAVLQQDFLDAGVSRVDGGVPIGSGGAVAYRRRYLRDLFHRYEPIRGDDFTALEDHFIALALMNAGYRNIRVPDVVARTRAPSLLRLPEHSRRWSAGFLQLHHYFDVLLRSPLRRLRMPGPARREDAAQWRRGKAERRVQEPYRQGFGERITRERGRPLGTPLALIALERIGYPVLLWVLALAGQWTALAIVVALEVLATCFIAARFASGPRLRAALQALAWAPVRYLLILQEPVALGWFAIRRWWKRDLDWHVRRDASGRRRPRAIRH